MPAAPYHLYRPTHLAARPWSVTARATQPGLAAWWRLVAPGLHWAQAHAKRVSFACLRGASLDPRDPARRTLVAPSIMALPHRERLITVTRGPMARKKQSRVQLLVRRQVLSLVTRGATFPTVLRSEPALGALTPTHRALGRVWAQPLGAPLVLVGARVSWPVQAAPVLAWS